ncbi:MAG: hypothetical protein WCI45_08195, partial [Desulfuromonadales bacterium]
TYIVSILVFVLLHAHTQAGESNIDVSKILAVVPVKSGSLDQSVYRQFDKLVPELKKISNKKIIKLECRYSGQTEREQDVENAYKLAARIERYLRVRHKLDLDLWVAIDITPKSPKSPPVLTIAVFTDDIKKLDAVLINPLKNEQQ